MSYLYTGSSQKGGISTGLSTQILIQVDGVSVGAVQELSINQSRSIKKITEIGTDGHVEALPDQASDVSVTCTRIVFDKKRMPEAFGRGFVNIHAQRIPFDIVVYDYSNIPLEQINPASFDSIDGKTGVISTVLENCWFKSLNIKFSSSDYVITEDCGIEPTWIHSFRDGTEASPVVIGEGFDALERLSDASRRGSLDGRGLGLVTATFDKEQGTLP